MAGANRMHRPHHGSMQIWPRVRAKRHSPAVRTWASSSETKLMGFMGYKAGMTHVLVKDQNPNSPTKGQNIARAATVIECPPLKVKAIRFYKQTEYGRKIAGEISTDKAEKELLRKAGKSKAKEQVPETYDELRLIAYTLPRLSAVGKKKPDMLEIKVAGSDKQKMLDAARLALEKGVRLQEVFKEGQMVDVHSVTKGKGFQGTVKRFGVKIRQAKSEKTKRGIGSLGSWTPTRVDYRVPQSGKMGYHLRTEYNKPLLKIGDKPEQVNPKGGFMHYGNIKGDYIIIDGSVPGPAKRPVAITEAIRAPLKFRMQKPVLAYVSQESKQ